MCMRLPYIPWYIAGVPSSQALPGFLTTAPPSVCVSDVIGALVCGFQTTLDPYLTMEAAMKHICWKINAAHQTVAAAARSLRYDSSATDRGIRSIP